MSNNTIPIRNSAFSQSHPRVPNTNNQYNNSFTQINHSHNHNHNHNHNHHHVHYNNSLHSKVTPTALPVIIQSKTVKQTTTTITQPFSSNKNNIPPLKTRSHSHNVNATQIATNPNIYRNNHASIQPLRHVPQPRLIPSRVPRPYAAVTPPNFMQYQTRKAQQQNLSIYNKYRHSNINQTAHHSSNLSTTSNNVSFPKEHHFKAPAASNFVHQSQSQSQSHISSKPLFGNEFGNVIIDGPLKAPSPIGLETIVSSAPSINSQENSNSPASHAFISHANSQRITKVPFSYQSNHMNHCNTTRKRKRLSECINPAEMAAMPYNVSNSAQNQRYNPSQAHYNPQAQHQSLPQPQQLAHTANVASMMMQPPFKKRKIVNYGSNSAQMNQQYLAHTPQMIQQQIQSNGNHMNQSQMNAKHNNQRYHNNVIRQRQVASNQYQNDNYGPAPFVNTGGTHNNNSISPPFAYTNHSVYSHQSQNSISSSQAASQSHVNTNNKAVQRPLKPPTPTMCTQRRKKQSKKMPKKKKQTRKKAHKPAAKLCAEPRNFRLKAAQSSNLKQEDLFSRIPKRKQRPPSPQISHPELSAGQLAPALMPMPSIISDESDNKHISKDLQSLPPLQPFPLYPQGPMMPPSPLGPMSVNMNGSPLPLNALPVMNGSPSNVPYSMHYTPGYSDTFNTYAYDSPSHDSNDYMVHDLKASISDIPMERNSPFVISDDERNNINNNNNNNEERTLTHFVETDESTQSEMRPMKPLRLTSDDLFDENDDDDAIQYDEFKKKQSELDAKLGWNEDSKMDKEFMDTLPLFPDVVQNEILNTNVEEAQSEDLKQLQLKKAAIHALYDVDEFELMDPEITRLRLTMDDKLSDEDIEDHETDRDSLCLFTSSLIGSIYHEKSQPQTLSVAMKCYVAHNEYNLTHGMSKRLHDRWKIKMPQDQQDALRNKLLNEWKNDRAMTSYKLMMNENENDPTKQSDDEGENEENDDQETMKDCSWIHDGVVTDWKRIHSLGVQIPSYCLDPSKYTSAQLLDPGCFKEKKVIQHPYDNCAEIEINFFIYIPGGDIMGQLKTQSGTFAPVVYEIGCEGMRQCALCAIEGKQCVGIIDLLNDENDRIWACQECKNAFRIGLKLNTRTKQYRLKENSVAMMMTKDVQRDEMNVDKEDAMNGANNNNNNEENQSNQKNNNNNKNHNDSKKKKKYSKKRKPKKKEKEGAFCETVTAFNPYVYDMDNKQYIFRYFEESDLDVLNHLDIKMTTQLLGTGADSYGKSWLHKLTNPQRKTHHIWRTIACAQLLDVVDSAAVDDENNNNNNNNNNKYHLVPNNADGYSKKKESKPIAFAMYKHMKNDVHLTKRYGELFWILVDNRHQRKGIASRLIDIMVNEAQREEKISEFRLHVLKNNDAAIPLYKKLAFTKKSSKQNYPKRNYESYRCIKML